MGQVTAVRRDDDGELLGRVVADGASWRAETVFGGLLDEPAPTAEQAEQVVREHGLASLAEPWWLDVPGQGWTRVWLVEVRTDRVRVAETDPSWGPVETSWVDVRERPLLRREPRAGTVR